MNRPPGRLRTSRGLGMVELLIALVLGMLITGAALQVFLGSKRSFEIQRELSRIQENGRFAIDYLTGDIRGSDYWGCLDSGLIQVTNRLDTSVPGGAAWEFDKGIDGTDGCDGATCPTNAALHLPDTLALRTGEHMDLHILPPYMPPPASTLPVADNSGIQKGDILFIGDCEAGDIFQVSNNPDTGTGSKDQVGHNTGVINDGSGNPIPPGNASGSLSKSYEADAMMLKPSRIVYSIEVDAGSGEPVLVRNGDKLVEGIENMQILYGEDLTGDGAPNRYLPADDVTSMEAVTSVRVSLLVRSLRDNLTTSAQAYDYNGATATPSDRRIRKVFTTNVAIRNRLK